MPVTPIPPEIVAQPEQFELGDFVVFQPGGYRHEIISISPPAYQGLAQTIFWVTYKTIRGSTESHGFANLNNYFIVKKTATT